MKQKIADIEQRLEQKVADFFTSTEPDNNFAERFEQQKRKSDRVAEAEQLFFDFFATNDYAEYVGLLKLDYRSNMCFLNFDYVNEFDKTHLFEHDLDQFLLRHAFASSQTNMHKKRVEMHIERSNS